MSRCKPCVTELWKQELRCWNECHPDGEEEASQEDLEEVEERRKDEERRASPRVEIELDVSGLKIALEAEEEKEEDKGGDT